MVKSFVLLITSKKRRLPDSQTQVFDKGCSPLKKHFLSGYQNMMNHLDKIPSWSRTIQQLSLQPCDTEDLVEVPN